MAQILFTAVAGAATRAAGIGGLLGSLLGTAAGFAGRAVDNALFGKKTFRKVEGPRLESLSVFSSTEGSPIQRIYGRMRVTGEMIWASRFLEEILETTETVSGGKGGGGGSSTAVTSTEYNYSVSFAVGLCEGEIGEVNRVWADGKDLDLSEIIYRVYHGTETQNPDSLIETKEGAGNVPGYRGLAYVVFENLPLKRYGNRIPQLSFEIMKPVKNAIAEGLITGVNLIPAATEFGYDTTIVEQSYGSAGFGDLERRVENEHLSRGVSDITASLDMLEKTCPNLEAVSLVVTWFGDDLRAGNCTIRPKVENSTKNTTPFNWAVSGLTRSTALVVSQIGNRPAFGGTPHDDSVKRAIAAIKAKGWKVFFYPFIMMDVAAGNTLPNPYSDNAATNGQAVYPWRGRITVSPAAGFVGTVDKTATAATQVSTFYNGTWGFKNFIEHYADLCASAGGVDYFAIGTEMIGLTTARSATSIYPFVTHLKSLAASVTAKLPAAKIGYAADWSEYHSHRPEDGSGDVHFHLDPLWSDANIDFIGMDNYMPLSDWRDEPGHTDGVNNPSIFDLDYLKSNIAGGEFHDWFYADDAAREAQTRTTISDGDPANEPWVFANKRLKDWWENAHHNRPGGVRSGSPTGWSVESKPVYFTELGCPAIDKGSNQPNVFVDPKSSESKLPYFSSGARDDVIQRQFIRAHYEYWAVAGNNPTSSVYAANMVDTSNLYIWAWDARPVPAFPYNTNIFSDGANWELGHWISNRFGTVNIPDFLAELSLDYPLSGFIDFRRAYGAADGYIIDRIMSFREAASELQLLFFFDFHDSGGKILARSKHEMNSVSSLTTDTVLSRSEDEDPVLLTRAQPIDLPVFAALRFLNADSNFKSASVQRRHPTANEVRESVAEVPIGLDMSRAQQIIDRWLYSIRAERQEGGFGAMPSKLAIEAGDSVAIPFAGATRDMRIQSVNDGDGRQMTALSFDRATFVSGAGGGKTQPIDLISLIASPAVLLMDLPLLLDTDADHAGYVGAFASPWHGVNVNRAPSDSNYQLNVALTGQSLIGTTRFDFFSGPVDRWDYGNELFIELLGGSLTSQTEIDVLAGANACAIENADGGWEVLQFQTALLESTLQYKLTNLLRGQKSTKHQMRSPVSAGARVVFFNANIRQIDMQPDDIGLNYFFRYGPADQGISSTLYTTEQKTFNGLGRQPYSVAHPKAARTSISDDVVLSWVRRTRIEGDSWNYTTDVPLSEDAETYEIDIWNAGLTSVLRTILATTQSLTYTAAQQTTDFGSPPSSMAIDFYQTNAQFGRSPNTRKTFTF